MNIFDQLKFWYLKWKAKRVSVKAGQMYSLEIKYLRDLSDDLTLILDAIKRHKRGEIKALVRAMNRVHKKLVSAERRTHRQVRRVEIKLSPLIHSLPDGSEQVSNIKSHLQSLNLEEGVLLRALSRVGGSLGLSFRKISRLGKKKELKISEEEIKQNISDDLKLIKELIRFANAAILDLNDLNQQTSGMSRREFIKKAVTFTASTTLTSATILELLKKLQKVEQLPESEKRAVFLLKSKNQEEVVAVRLRPGWSFSIISRLYCKKRADIQDVLKRFNPQKLSLGGYLFIPIDFVKKDLIGFLIENQFYYSDLSAGSSIPKFVKANLMLKKGLSYKKAVNILLAFNNRLPYHTPKENDVLRSSISIIFPKGIYHAPIVPHPDFRVPDVNRYLKFQTPTTKSWATVQRSVDSKRDVFGALRVRNKGTDEEKKETHMGFDVRAKVGTKLYPMAFGEVTKVKSNWDISYKEKKKKNWRSGNYVQIKLLYLGLTLTYLHLDTINVRKGDFVGLKTVIGTVGLTGNAKPHNPHVHIVLKKGKEFLDPVGFLNGSNDQNYREYILDRPKLVKKILSHIMKL